MFLIHPHDLSIHEVDREQLTIAEGARVLFRVTASFDGIFIHGRFPGCKVKHEALVFLKLRNGHGWVWASSISVVNDGKFPVDEPSLGNDFLFVWPVPVAINAFFEIKEKRRVQALVHSSTFDACVMAHPPCISYVPSKDGTAGRLALPTVRRLEAAQLTVAQRLFVASLVPHVAPFSTRNLPDKWCARLKRDDRAQFEEWRAANGLRASSEHAAATCLGNSRLHANARAAGGNGGNGGNGAGASRRATACPLLELPDDLLERIVSTHLSKCLLDSDLLQAKVCACARISTQFGRVTRMAANRMLDRVVDAAQSLLTDCSREPLQVQLIVHAAGLSLRHALMMSRGNWGLYMHVRRRFQVHGHDMTAEQRWRLLW